VFPPAGSPMCEPSRGRSRSVQIPGGWANFGWAEIATRLASRGFAPGGSLWFVGGSERRSPSALRSGSRPFGLWLCRAGIPGGAEA